MSHTTRHRVIWCLCVGLGAILLSGCTPAPVRDPQVETVTYYGRTLDKDAAPLEVAYALTRAMRDDFLAESKAKRDEAIDKQFALAASGMLRASNPSSLDDNEFLHEIVYRWTPAVSHYIHDFDLTWEEAQEKFREISIARPMRIGSTTFQTRVVLVPLTDPEAGPSASTVLMLRFIQDDGYWRVFRLEFDRKHRTILDSRNALSALQEDEEDDIADDAVTEDEGDDGTGE